jgi:hypothetical protein
MAISTYAELKTAVDNWLARTDLTSRVPEFISLAEARMSREIEALSRDKRITATLVADDEYVSLPTDVRKIRHVRLNTNPITILRYLTPQAIDREYPSTGTGKPRVYSVIGSEIYFRPAPDSGYTAEILYNAGMDLLTSDSQTTTLLTRHPDLYLHGALAEAYGFLLDEARQAHHDSLFTRVLNEVQMEEDRVHYGGSPLTLQSDYGELRT